MTLKHKQKLAKKALAAVFMAAVIVCAADVSESFESLDAMPAAWEGYGSVEAATPTAPQPAGYPIASATHNNVLNVDGYVTVPVTSDAIAGSTVDMMVKVVLPDEPLAFPANEETGDVQIALGVDKTATEGEGEIKVWNGSEWQTTGKIFAADTWVRVTFRFNYSASPKKCQLLVNGEPALVNGDSWVNIIKSDAAKVASVKLVGTTSVDDMVVKAGALEQLPVTTKTDGVTDMTVADNYVSADGGIKVDKQWLTDNGIVWTAAAVNAKASGETLSVAQKYAAGFEPTAQGAVLKIESMKMVEEDSAVKVEVTLPVGKAGNGYKNVVQTKGADGDWDAGTEVDANGKAKITLPSGGVRYYRVVTQAK